MTDIIDLDERGPGRTRSPGRRPSPRRRARTARYNAAVDGFTKQDPVVTACSKSSLETFYAVRLGVAQEAASLLWARLNEVPGSREAARISSRRIVALAEVARLTVAIGRANPGEPSPERLGRVLRLLRRDIEEVAVGLFDGRIAAAFLLDLSKRLPEDVTKWGLIESAPATETPHETTDPTQRR